MHIQNMGMVECTQFINKKIIKNKKDGIKRKVRKRKRT